MTRTASNHGLTSRRAADWRDTAACLGKDPEIFFERPDLAKTICAPCPSAAECLQFALDESIQTGVFGGLTENERRNLRRQNTRAARVTPLKKTDPKPPPPATLEEAFTRRTQTTDDGHVIWTGANQFKFQATRHNPLHVAFRLGHGRAPEGPVRRTCGRACFLPEHLTDAVLRDSDELCGTRPGYHRHRRRGEDACGPCKRANADADNRLRRTGTTLAAA